MAMRLRGLRVLAAGRSYVFRIPNHKVYSLFLSLVFPPSVSNARRSSIYTLQELDNTRHHSPQSDLHYPHRTHTGDRTIL